MLQITTLRWGHMEVTHNGAVQTFKDCLAWPDGACEWDWSRTGTRHQPGIQPADLAPLLAAGVTTVILSRGMDLQLHTAPETIQLLEERGIAYAILETREAVARFNALSAAGQPVGGVFHSTC